jgi:hypothetical protein
MERGGILLAWHFDHFEATGLQSKELSLSMEMKPRWTGSNFLLSTDYGPTEEDAKQRFLD